MLVHETDTPAGLRAFLAGKGTGEAPCRVGISGQMWREDPAFYEGLQAGAPDVKVSSWQDPQRGQEVVRTDGWGCKWHFPGRYLDGQVIGHPLADWDAYRGYELPDPARHTDWAAVKRQVEADHREGRAAWGLVEHGFLYLKMTYLRGFENFMIDVAERRTELWELRDRIADFWLETVRRYVEAGVDAVSFGDDLGHQNALPMSPATWRDLLKGAYQRIYQRCRQDGVIVYMHTDGWILDIIPDLLEAGVDMLNPQDLVNGLDNLRRLAKGKVSIDLDVDRQSVTVFGTPAEVEAHIRHCIEKLGSPRGGLMLIHGVYEGTPKGNIAACVRAMQKHHDMWARE